MELLNVKVWTPKESLFLGKARSVSSKNSQGNFDILAGHANFISIVEGQPVIIVDEKGEKHEFAFSQAIIYNNKDNVSVYANPLGK